MADNGHQQIRPRNRVLRGSNFVVYLIVVIGIIVLANWFANQHDVHWDLTPNKEFSLSAQTLKILKGLRQPVTLYVFDRADALKARKDLLGLYSSASSRVSVRYVDPDRDPGLAKEFGVRSYGSIYVAAGTRHLEAESATEQAITNSLIRLLKGTKTMYFVQGHGERNLDSADRFGYQKLKQSLASEDSDVKTLVLLQTMQIPADCSLLVIAGPQKDYLPQEVDLIEKYVQGGGRVLFLLDAGVDMPNLAKLFQDENVTLANDLVIDQNPVSQIFGTNPSMPLILKYGSNPIVQPLQRTATLFPISRSFEIGKAYKQGVTVDSLCETSAQSYGVMGFNLQMREVSFRAGKDIKGPLTVAVAGTVSAGPGGGKKEGRFVAVGTSLLASNAYLNFQGNRDLVMNMVDWLAANEDLISIRPKPQEAQRLNLTGRQMSGLMVRTAAIPLIIIIIGIFVWWSRR
ncbi:MAG TPA: Gldg family protein [Terriglobia bacterium]|nr:Gldg family protein [Terriglobia bacterium]